MASSGEQRTRTVVRERGGNICELQLPEVCLGLATNISHRKAVSQGGKWEPANCLHSCGSGSTGCHGWVENHPNEARRLGLRLRRGDAPAAEPAYIRTVFGLGWYLLHDDGTVTDVSYEEEHGRWLSS